MAELYATYTLEQLKNLYNEKIPIYRRDFKKKWTRQELIQILSSIGANTPIQEYEPVEEETDIEEIPLIEEVSISNQGRIKEERLSNDNIKSEKHTMKTRKTASPLRQLVGQLEGEYEPVTSITYKDLQTEIRNPVFIESFKNSIISLMKYKLSFYQKKLEEMEKENERVQEKADALKRNGSSDEDIHKMFPMKRFYIGMIVSFKEIQETIKQRLLDIDMGLWNVQTSLIDAIENEKYGLLSISGRENIKNSFASQLYAFGQNYRTFTESFNNICLLGGAGTGKTRLAKVASYVYNKSGLLAFDFAKIVSRVDLVEGSIGQTAPKTKAVLMETLESVLFIDEAYQLGVPKDDANSRDFGPEAITEIVNFLDKYIGMNIVIVAGYPREMMDRFFPTNEGLERRFPIRIVLQDYTAEELCSILIGNIQEKLERKIDDDTKKYICALVTFMHDQDRDLVKNQAGDMLNLGTSIVQSINSAYKRKWKEGDLDNNIPILKDGFNAYLKPKNYILE